MKRIWPVWAYCFLLLALLPAFGRAEEAPDITGRCAVTAAPASQGGKADMQDGSYLTYCTFKALEIRAPEGVFCGGLYLRFAKKETSYRVEIWREEQWETAAEDTRLYANSYLSLPAAERVRVTPIGQDTLSVAELTVLGEGEKPAWVQDWREWEGKADLLVLSAHADDELLFFGGVIPYYTLERGRHVIVCYLTEQTSCRRNELLDGLWLCGVREYPRMGVFKDIKNNSLGDSYAFWGKEEVVAYVTGLLRRYRPDVALTHDLKGEYGHGAHRVCADAMIRAAELAADPAYRPDLGESWRVRKTYLHLYRENPVVFDWRQPLAAFEGRTAFDVAKAAFDCHKSQKSNGLIVQDWGPHANNIFGLYLTDVGPDERADDLFEHLPQEEKGIAIPADP